MSGHDGMKGHNQVTDQRQILLPRDPAPRAAFLLLSVFAHLAGLALLSVSWRAERAHIVPEKFRTAQQISGKVSPRFNSIGSMPARSHARPSHAHRSAGQARVPTEAESVQADARITAGLVDPTIERTLLSAIREFRYRPAKHDGSPIPSQLDIVIHIPS